MRFVVIAAAAACLSAPAVSGPVVPFARVIGGSVDFGKTADGRTARLYTLTNRNGMRVRFTDYGGRITEIATPDRAGKYANVAIGLRSATEYQAGPTPGLDGRYWTVSMRPLNINHGAVLTMVSPDGDQEHRGKRVIKVRYTLTRNDELRVDISITPAEPALLNRISPLIFNLGGQRNSDVGGHLIQIRANSIAEIDPTNPVSPNIVTVTDPYDLRSPRMMRDGIDKLGVMGLSGYDTTYIVADRPRKKPVLAARVTEPNSGRMMEVYTTEPSLRFVTTDGARGPDTGTPNAPYPGFALAPKDLSGEPAKVLRAGKTYRSTTIYKFVTPIDRLHS